MRRRTAPVLMAAIMSLGGVTCGGQEGGGDQVGVPMASLEWTFEPDSLEKGQILSLIGAVVQSTAGVEPTAHGVLYRFGLQTQTRYLLLTRQASATQLDDLAVLIVLSWSPTKVSSPLVIGRWGIGGFGPVTVGDQDGDQNPDVTYCVWSTDESQDGEPMTMGFGSDGWYQIPEPSGPIPTCEVIA